jgi:hypothetical protein
MTFHAVIVAGTPADGLVAFRRDAIPDAPVRANMFVNCTLKRNLTLPAWVMDVTLAWDPVMVLYIGEETDTETVDYLSQAEGWEPIQVLSDSDHGPYRFYCAPATPSDEPLHVLPHWNTLPANQPLNIAGSIRFSRPAQRFIPALDKTRTITYLEDETGNNHSPDDNSVTDLASWRNLRTRS